MQQRLFPNSFAAHLDDHCARALPFAGPSQKTKERRQMPFDLTHRALALITLLITRPIALLIAAAILTLLAAPVTAQPLADPRVDWQSADTPHFRVHYRSTQRQQADAVARAAERAWPQVTTALNWQVRGRTEIVVYNEFDMANGFSTPLPFNMIGVFLAPPDEGELLDNHSWLDLLLVHELTHAVHLDKVRGGPRILQAIFGNVPWFIPNVFQPGWMVEGLAVFQETKSDAGEGRLRAPLFEGWLRAERKKGFLTLREINSDGRALPLNKQYLYGAYFMDFVARKYGADKITDIVEQYSGNIIFPRLHSAPFGATGKMMDVLWDEFIADLTQQMDARNQALLARPEVVGSVLVGPLFNVGSVAALPAAAGGGWLAVVEDGLNGSQLLRIHASGARERVARVNRGARVEVSPDGSVLVAQPDICNTLNYAYDAYRLQDGKLNELTRCGHLRRVTQVGSTVYAVQLEGGRTRLVQLGANGAQQLLWEPPAGTDLVDLAAAPNGQSLRVISHRGADWRVLDINIATPQAAPQVLVRQRQPLFGLRQSASGLEFVMGEGGTTNVWRLNGADLQRLTHSHTAVLAHAGTAADGSLVSVTVDPQGVALQRLAQPTVLQTVPAVAATADMRITEPAAMGAADPSPLGEARSYSALRSLYPRSWLPAITRDRGLSAYGATTSGADALGWHRYAALVQWETSQKQLTGSLEYQFVGNHGIALERRLQAQAWTGDSGSETTTLYDRKTKAQWLSLFPFSRIERGVVLGVGAAAEVTDRVSLPDKTSNRRQDERLLAALLDLDFAAGDWYSEGSNRGFQASLLVESYKPLAGNDPLRYDGTVARADLRGYLPVGRSVFAARFTEARARQRTAPFQLGGATDDVLQLGPTLNNRSLSLRGYRGDEAVLKGTQARVATLEWRTPLADIDRHFMVPALGINRLSAVVFAEAGGAWNSGGGPDKWRRSVGVELIGEVKLLYVLGLQLRLGVAQGLDAPKSTQGYLTAGRAF
jgi:hypothetical protein